MRERLQRYQVKLDKFLRQIGRVRAYKRLFNTKDGQVVLKDLIKSFNPHNSSFNECPRKSAYLEGQKSVIMAIIKVLKIEDDVIFGEISKLKQERKGGIYGRQSEYTATRAGLQFDRPAGKQLQRNQKYGEPTD